jgi:uncharacterized membrane protein
MAPLIFLLVAFSLLFGIDKFLLKRKLSLSFIGRVSLAIMLIVTGVAHFTSSNVMVEMMPEFLPMKKEIVYLTGILEFLAAVGLLIGKLSKITAILLIIYFVAILPANIVGSFKQVNLGGMEYGAMYLLFRVPLQILFIFWTYYFGIRINNKQRRG